MTCPLCDVNSKHIYIQFQMKFAFIIAGVHNYRK